MNKIILSVALLSGAALLAACNSGGGGSTTTGGSDAALSGTAAVGLPIVDATLSAKCANGADFSQIVTTNAQGVWSGTVPSASLPCVLQISGGTVGGSASTAVLHSLALGAGTVNVTPLTDMAFALSIKTHDGRDIADWFANPGNWSSVADNLATHVAALTQALVNAGYTLPAGDFDPFTTPFSANQADIYDVLLDAIADAVANSGSYASYEELRDSIVGGGTLPPAPDNEGGSPLSPDGDGATLAGGNGATGTVNSTVHTYSDNVGFAVVNQNGLFTAIDTNVLNKWEVIGFDPVPGVQSCGSGGDHPMVRLALNGVMYAANITGGECAIEILSVSDTEVEGRFAARLIDSSGNTFAVVTDGYFRYEMDNGETSEIEVPAGEAGIALTIDGTSYLWQVAPSIDVNYYTDWYQMSVNSANTYPSQTVYIYFVPKELGTYSCGSGQPYRKLNAYVRWDYVYYSANDTVGNCTFTVTRADSYIEGTFSGTFVADTSAQKVVTNGSFRFIAP